MEHTKFTVIIPTRERCETLYHTLRTCVDQTYENLEIIVSDNCSRDDTKAVVSSFGDARIRYVNTGRRVSMSENFEFGLSHVRDGFLMFIGDDDGLLPEAVKRANAIVHEHGVKAVMSGTCLYVWPNHPDVGRRNSISWPASSTVEIRNAAEWINKVLTFEPLYVFDLPGLYGGFAHIDVVRSMYKDGVFFRSVTPDAYSAFACAVALDRYAFSNRPFSIAGASGRSNGASYLLGVDKSESDRFFEENNIPFHPALRMCPSFRIIAAEAFLQLKDAFPALTQDYKLDVPRLLKAAMQEGNALTAPVIRQAIADIASANEIEPDAIAGPPNRRALPRRFQDMVTKMSNVYATAGKFVSIADVSGFGAYNVYDAGKVANVFMDLNEGARVARVPGLGFERLLSKLTRKT